jgi:hypothetical protein
METPRMLLSRRYCLGMLAALQTGRALAGPANVSPSSCAMTNVQSFGAKGDGVTDDTNALQNACNSGQVLYFPKTSAFYKTSHFLDLSNSVSSNGAEIRLNQDGTTATSIFRILPNASPITVDGFILNGLYNGGTAHEFSRGVDIRGATNVIVSNNIIKNTYGDNIYMDRWTTPPSRNIYVINNTLMNPRRCNIGIIHADTVTIKNNIINKTVDYVTGIDMEPDSDGFGYVKNVTISGNNFNCPSICIDAAINNGIPNTGLLIQNNTATGIQFFWSETALLSGAIFSYNTFTCKKPTQGQPQPAAMFVLGNVASSTLASNIDQTVRAGSYKSVYQFSSQLALINNTFIT